MDTFDLVIIGAGPGGYVAAIRAAQLGLKTALVEKRSTLGGTCLNVGCIPSKALLHLSAQFAFVADEKAAAAAGIKTKEVSLDLAALMKRKNAMVGGLVKGVGTLVEKRGVEVVRGTGRLGGDNKVVVKPEDGGDEVRLAAKAILLATGSVPVELPFLKFDGKTVISSDHAIALDKVPEELVVVGAGAIGLELGSVWARLGSKVTVVEMLPRIAAGFDEEVARHLQRSLGRQGLTFELAAKVTGLNAAKGKKKAVLTAERDDQKLTFPADQVLVAVGRRPATRDLGLEDAGVELDDNGRIKTNTTFQTTAKGIYAIGDLIAGPMLAHKGEEEGVAVAEILAGKPGEVDHNLVPNVVYTEPEAASVGLTEAAAKEKGLDVRIGKFSFGANGRAIATGATEGFAKVVADAKTDRILGVHLLGHHTSELIAEAVAHMTYGGSAEDLGRTIHAHPTLSEALKEAGLAVSKSAIHAL
ncbi:MAG: dihydrolipoyl dehydrogenase [Puniceicoccaceae bacterium]|nr:MAG: dihydrolipoyl dehydrogenase [Puniceicoccaceae bacterium]